MGANAVAAKTRVYLVNAVRLFLDIERHWLTGLHVLGMEPEKLRLHEGAHAVQQQIVLSVELRIGLALALLVHLDRSGKRADNCRQDGGEER